MYQSWVGSGHCISPVTAWSWHITAGLTGLACTRPRLPLPITTIHNQSRGFFHQNHQAQPVQAIQSKANLKLTIFR